MIMFRSNVFFYFFKTLSIVDWSGLGRTACSSWLWRESKAAFNIAKRSTLICCRISISKISRIFLKFLRKSINKKLQSTLSAESFTFFVFWFSFTEKRFAFMLTLGALFTLNVIKLVPQGNNTWHNSSKHSNYEFMIHQMIDKSSCFIWKICYLLNLREIFNILDFTSFFFFFVGKQYPRTLEKLSSNSLTIKFFEKAVDV